MTSGAWVEGRLAKDPRPLGGDSCVIAVATDEFFGVAGGGSRKRTYYITAYCNNRVGHNAMQYGKAGRRVIVEGKLMSRVRKLGEASYTETYMKVERLIWVDPAKKRGHVHEAWSDPSTPTPPEDYQYPEDIPF